jgi:hypothetical protein
MAAGLGSLCFAPLIRLDLNRERDMVALVGEFTDPGCNRYDLSSPWEFQSQSVASDGRALICIPGLSFVHTGEEGRRPDVGQVFNKFWPTIEKPKWRQWLPLPPVERVCHPNPLYDQCPRCIRDNECHRCDGEGTTWSDEDHWNVWNVSCPDCCGHGYNHDSGCTICHGTEGVTRWLEPWGNALISARYAEMVRQIPGARWMPGKDHESPILIRGDGAIRSLVMTVDPR